MGCYSWFSGSAADDAGSVGFATDWKMLAPRAVKRDPKDLSHDVPLWKDFEDVLRQNLGLPEIKHLKHVPGFESSSELIKGIVSLNISALVG